MDKTYSKIVVTFKESYMENPVTRECHNMSQNQVIEVYGLKEPDIEWYKFTSLEE